MSEFQVVTVVATVIGLVATVLNLVAFFREKEKAHIRAGLVVVAALVVALGIVLLPRYAPGVAQGVVSHLPAPAGVALQGWANPQAQAQVTPMPEPVTPPLQGSFAIELHRNLLGGIDALMAKFQFSNVSKTNLRVTAYHLKLHDHAGAVAHSYYRVLSQPVEVSPLANAAQEVELDAEIRDRWLAWQEQESHGPVEITWEAHNAEDGRVYRISSSNG
jgi:hypothetical protein